MRLSDLVIANLRDALFLHPAFPLRHFGPKLGFAEMSLNINGAGRFRFRTNNSDAIILREIFRDRGYDMAGFPQVTDVRARYDEILDAGRVPVIIDGGANIGGAAVWFARTFPAAAILSVEPERSNAALCRRNVAHLPKVQVVEAALGAVTGHGTIANMEEKAWAFQVSRSEDGEIPVVTIPELVASVPDGVLFGAKIDIEGFESDVFLQNTAWLDDVKFVFLEPHDWMLPGAKTSRAFQRQLAARDFDLLVAGENLLYVAAAAGATAAADRPAETATA